MRLYPVALFVLLVVFVLLDESDAARGRGSRGSSRSSSSSRSKSKSKSRSKTSGSSYNKPKITKYTPIKATTARSPVIVRQAKLGSRSNVITKAVVGYTALRYVLATAPVYRGGYPMHRSYVSIPKKRAVRVTYEEEKLMDDGGKLCLGKSSAEQKLREGIDQDLFQLSTTVKYKKSGETKTYQGDTISLEDIKEQDFEVISRARYNTTIVEGTNCTQVEKSVQGTMVEMYETNPGTASSLFINNKLLTTAIALFAVIHVFQILY